MHRDPRHTPQDSPPQDRSLILGNPRTKPLTRGQKTFNRLVRRIEDLRKEMARETERLDRLMGAYAADLHPLELDILEQRKALVRALRPFLKGKSLPGRRQRDTLRTLLYDQLETIQSIAGPVWTDEDLRDLWNELDAVFRARRSRLDDTLFNEFQSVAEQEFDAMGLKVDLSKFRPGMTPQEFQEAMEDVHRQVEEAPDPEPKPRGTSQTPPGSKPRPTAADRKRLEEELRQRDLSSLYKQLAKLLHPDLEADPTRRAEKESAMKRLTTAYKDRDLHALLELELEWIQHEGADASRLGDQKLRIYNIILEEQARDLEDRLREISLHPRYAPLQRYSDPFEDPGMMNPRKVRERLTTELQELKTLVCRLSGPDILPEVRQLIQDYRTAPSYSDPF
ncbi:MAG: J domain-containing protein [Verrucomicrobiales bacterium]|nr:J domain-containing protein [Verrucomicrobiales bacterium]